MPRIHPAPPQSRSGFTLIELLVVISIIALLIAILLPALRSARDAAQLVKCGTQQKQVMLGMHMYFADYDSWTPDPANYFNTGTGQWERQMTGNISGTGDKWRGYQNKLAQLEYVGSLTNLQSGLYTRRTRHTDISVFACPKDLNDEVNTFIQRVPVSYLANMATPNAVGIPGFFDVGSMGVYPFGGNPYSVKSNLDLYAAPSAYFSLIEVNSNEVGTFAAYALSPPLAYVGAASSVSSRPIRNRNESWRRNFSHGVSNIAFADGHVASLSERELQFTSDDPDGIAKTENWYLNTGAIKTERHTP